MRLPRRTSGLLLVAVFLLAAGHHEASLPEPLVHALDRRDPLALADTTLPRVSDLDPAQRAALAESLATWAVSRRVAAWAFLQVGTPYELGPLGDRKSVV